MAKKMPQKASLKLHSPQLAIKHVDVKKEVQRLISKSAQKEAYAVQLASFAQQDNAKSLVSLLRKKGYRASYEKLDSKKGAIYKVLVGRVPQKDVAHTLQKELANNLQLKGFVVKTGVS
jgi:DedD protein